MSDKPLTDEQYAERREWMRDVRRMNNEKLAGHIRGYLWPNSYQDALEREALSRILEFIDKKDSP